MKAGLYHTCDGTLGSSDVVNCCSVISWVGSEGTVLLDIFVIRTSRGGSAEFDEIDEASDSDTLPTATVESGTVAEVQSFCEVLADL